MNVIDNKKTYATFGLERSWFQIRQALLDRRNAKRNMHLLFQLLQAAEARMVAQAQQPIEHMRILEIGPGQGMERARYFGIKNQVIGLDLDVIPIHMNLQDYYRVLKLNGMGRLAKTLGRKLIVAKANENAWCKAVGVEKMPYPLMLHGDICGKLPSLGQFDLIMSWSVFEHLPDPRTALENVIGLLKPGGIFYLSLHLYTSNNGHHDIRAFTGLEEKLPLWGHLRQSTRTQIFPSSYLNQWRLFQWRELFASLTPGHTEFLESNDFHCRNLMGIHPELRAELGEYRDEELSTVDAVYVWQKPAG
jgi:SAM-dependent methyltransferase